MLAVVYPKPLEFSIDELPDPVPGPGEVLLAVLLTGVCGTDLHLHEGEFSPTYPLIPGHEIVGEVQKIGIGVRSLQIGQKVVLDNTIACGHCVECRRHRTAYCTTLIAHGVNAPGGFADMFLARASQCFAVDDLPSDVAVFAEPLACVIHGLDVLQLQPGADVLMFGAGPTGILLAQMLKNSGAGRLTVAAPTLKKLRLLQSRGADNIVVADRSNPKATADQLRVIAPDGFDVVIDATGSIDVLGQALGLTRTGGTVFVYGMTAEAAILGVSPYDIFRRELTIKGSFAQQYSFDRSIQALRLGAVDTDGMITHRFGLAEYKDALAAVRDSDCIKVVVAPH